MLLTLLTGLIGQIRVYRGVDFAMRQVDTILMEGCGQLRQVGLEHLHGCGLSHREHDLNLILGLQVQLDMHTSQ